MRKLVQGLVGHGMGRGGLSGVGKARVERGGGSF